MRLQCRPRARPNQDQVPSRLAKTRQAHQPPLAAILQSSPPPRLLSVPEQRRSAPRGRAAPARAPVAAAESPYAHWPPPPSNAPPVHSGAAPHARLHGIPRASRRPAKAKRASDEAALARPSAFERRPLLPALLETHAAPDQQGPLRDLPHVQPEHELSPRRAVALSQREQPQRLRARPGGGSSPAVDPAGAQNRAVSKSENIA